MAKPSPTLPACLSRYVDLIMIRTFDETVLTEMAEHADVPVINGLTDRTHPCQIMADVMTFEEHRGPIAGRKVVWTGDGNNVCASFLHAAGQFGFDLTFTGPPQFDPEEEFMGFARKRGSKVVIERDPMKAVAGADLVVADTWVSMHDAQSARERRHNMLRPYQVNDALMAGAKPDALFMHCLPAHREEEVTIGGDGRAAFGGLRRGREPPARAKGDHALVPRGLTRVLHLGASPALRLPP